MKPYVYDCLMCYQIPVHVVHGNFCYKLICFPCNPGIGGGSFGPYLQGSPGPLLSRRGNLGANPRSSNCNKTHLRFKFMFVDFIEICENHAALRIPVAQIQSHRKKLYLLDVVSCEWDSYACEAQPISMSSAGHEGSNCNMENGEYVSNAKVSCG
jgi:hypothetical protein